VSPILIVLLPFTLKYRSLKNTSANYFEGFIGKVDKHSELQLKTDYNLIHPPLNTDDVPASFNDNTIDEEPDADHHDSGTGYNPYNPNTYSGNTSTFRGSSSVPSYGYQQGGSYHQGGTVQQSGMQTWTGGQDPYQMSRSTSQPGYYGTAGSSGNMYYPGSQHGVDEGDRHRRGSVQGSEHSHHSDPVEEEGLEEKTETETEYQQQSHYDQEPEDEHPKAADYHEDIYDP
jgi:hypothetical protein